MKREKNSFLIILIACTILWSCSKKVSKHNRLQAYEQGENIYSRYCTTCHNIDPSKPGLLAPSITRNDLETIQSMIMKGKLPNDEKSKWPGRIMAPLPHLKEYIPDLYEYLKTFN